MLQCFPSKSRTAIGPLFRGLCRRINGGTKTQEQLGTLRTHQIHFLSFCHKHHLLDFLFLVESKEEAWSLNQLNIAMGCYALYLATGHTIYCKSIKGTTIEEYLKAASGLIKN